MIAACPSCGARYRIDRAKLRPEGARLRCSRCENVFRVRAPEAAPRPPQAPAPAKPLQTPAVRAAPTPPPEAMPQPAPERSTVAPESQALVPTVEPAKTNELEGPVLIAHPEVEEGRRVAEALAARGLETLVVNDGVEAILNIQRSLPRVVVLDAALPKMFGFQVCEIVKRNESLRGIHVVLVGAIHDQDRYRRPPRDLYGADAYVERQELPDALIPLLEGFGVALGPPVQPPALPLRKDPAPAPALPLQRDPSPAPSATEAVPTPVHREPTPLSAVPSAPTIGPPAAAPFTGAPAALDPVEPPTETSAAPQP